MKRAQPLFPAFALFWFFSALTANVFAASDPFPVYECLRPNVAFWEKIYTRYSSNQGVLHDSSDLTVIYEVVDLAPRQWPTSRKVNEKRIRESKQKYEFILEKLSRGDSPSGPEETRVAALFGPSAMGSDFLAAKRNLRCQVGQSDRFREGLIRSGAFLDEIKSIFRSYGLPEDLAYLPHVESSFDHNAYSKFGAAGMWQFMRSTGKRFMEIGYTIDERRDPVRSSHAAAKLLKENYEILADWPCAITAYNHGQAGMLRARQSAGTYEEIFKRYGSRLFKFASRNFYSEFLAARDIAKNHRHYFGELELDKPLKYREIVLAGYVPVRDLVRNSDLSMEEIRRLNPALREPVYNGQKHIPKGYALRLPATKGGSPETDDLLLAQQIYKPEQKHSLYHTVRKGDTASEIARLHGIELSRLTSVNNLDRNATIYPGQNLHIPASDGKGTVTVVAAKPKPALQPEPAPAAEDVPDVKEEELSLSPTPLATDLDEAVETGEPDTEPPAEAEGESAQVASLESMPGVPVSQESVDQRLASLENVPIPAPGVDDEIRTGGLNTKPSLVAEDLVVQRVMTHDGKAIGVIRTEAEETLGHYADWLSVPTRAIRKLNGFKFGRVLKIHELVKIPLDSVSREDFEEKRFEYHKQMQEDFFAAYEVENIKAYRIRAGDNIWTLCKEVFEVPMWLVVAYNPDLDFDSLRPSRELLVPVVKEKAEKR